LITNGNGLNGTMTSTIAELFVEAGAASDLGVAMAHGGGRENPSESVIFDIISGSPMPNSNRLKAVEMIIAEEELLYGRLPSRKDIDLARTHEVNVLTSRVTKLATVVRKGNSGRKSPSKVNDIKRGGRLNKYPVIQSPSKTPSSVTNRNRNRNSRKLGKIASPKSPKSPNDKSRQQPRDDQELRLIRTIQKLGLNIKAVSRDLQTLLAALRDAEEELRFMEAVAIERTKSVQPDMWLNNLIANEQRHNKDPSVSLKLPLLRGTIQYNSSTRHISIHQYDTTSFTPI